MNLEKGIELFEAAKYDEAYDLLMELKEQQPENDQIYYYLGKILYKRQKFGDAINQYLKALEINPEYKEAEIGIRLIRNISSISNSFYFENPYTDEDLIENL